MKIVADENIPGVEALFGGCGDISLMPGRAIANRDIRDADALLVRSVTPVDERLLRNSRVQFVGSATIGTDHVNLAELERRGIAFANAPGCNAEAVVDYVLAALTRLRPDWPDRTVGIVGCGNVGSRLYRRLRAVGVDCRCYDPFLGPDRQPDLCDFEDLLAADILCLHTPLTREGPFPTHHLFDAPVLSRLRPGALLLNAGRGAVVDNRALLNALLHGRLDAVLDVWEGEPAIDPALMRAVALGTPHVAGYSLEGRVRGTLMIYRAWSEWCGHAALQVDVEALIRHLALAPDGNAAIAASGDWRATVLAAYDPVRDHRALVAAMQGPDPVAGFDRLRRDYPWRREFSHYRAAVDGDPAARFLQGLGFRVS